MVRSDGCKYPSLGHHRIALARSKFIEGHFCFAARWSMKSTSRPDFIGDLLHALKFIDALVAEGDSQRADLAPAGLRLLVALELRKLS